MDPAASEAHSASAVAATPARHWYLRWLLHPRAPLSFLVLGLVLAAPSLGTGLAADDHYHRVVLRGGWDLAPATTHPLDLFVFLDGNADSVARRMRAGMLPWWADPHTRLAFFRPISSLTHLIDERCWPARPWLMHAHSLLWFGLVLVAAAGAYRRLSPAGPACALALLIFAVDDAHGPTLGWLANRNALVALALSLPALGLHDRLRRDGFQPGAWLGPACLLLGLLAGEAAIATFAYLVAYAVVLDPEGPRVGLLRLAPFAAAIALYGLCYSALGYGAHGSGVYVDPLHERWAFVVATVVRLPILLSSLLAIPWSETWLLYPMISPLAPLVAWVAALLLIACVGALALPSLRSQPQARFWALGTVLSAVPVCATVPSDRLLLFCSVGSAGLLGCIFQEARLSSLQSSLPRRIGLGALVAVHLVLAPLLLPIRSRSMVTVARALENADGGLPRGDDVRDQTVVLVNPPGDMMVAYVPMTRASLGVPAPARMTWLATGDTAVEVRRLDERTLVVTPKGGFMRSFSEQMTRSAAHPMAVGELVDLGFVRVRVTRLTDDKRPAEARFEFTLPLEAPSLRWYAWGSRTFETFRVPSVGTSITLPPVNLLDALLK